MDHAARPVRLHGAFAVDLPPTASGTIEYEIQYTASGAHSPYIIGKGTTIVVNVATSGLATGHVIEATDAALATTSYWTCPPRSSR